MRSLFSYLILFLLISYKPSHKVLGIEVAKQELSQALNDELEKPMFVRHPIRDKKNAVGVAEPILFKIYGENKIADEKPYEIYLIDGYWVLMGTLPKNMLGGTFLIILSAKEGKVIKLIHGK
jgi:hypothetical protein